MTEPQSNQRVFESKKAVALYSSRLELQKPEATILQLLETTLRNARVLDIGVGGGRTTKYLAASAREYVGIDYSAEMINTCQNKFRNSKNVRFLLCDATDMRPFIDHYFDIVMFSFNGLDCVGHDDRLRVLREVKRVLSNGGWFIFSTHNIRSAAQLFHYFPIWPPKMPPWEWALAPIRNAKRRVLNPGWSEQLKKEFAILIDGAHEWRLSTYYVNPRAMQKQLLVAGFTSVRVFSLAGTEIDPLTEHLEKNRDPWLYYLCQAVI